MSRASCATTMPSAVASTLADNSGTRFRRLPSSASTAGSVILGLLVCSGVRASPQYPQCRKDAFEESLVRSTRDRWPEGGHVLRKLGSGLAPGQPWRPVEAGRIGFHVVMHAFADR